MARLVRSLPLYGLLCACIAGDDESWSQHADQIVVGGNAACALEADGRVACWGDSFVLQRGEPTTGGADVRCIEPFIPSDAIGVFCANPYGVRVDTDLRFVELTATWNGTFCGLTAEGAVHCWPRLASPDLPEVDDYSKSVEVSGSTRFRSISGSTRGFVGIADDDRGYRGQIGVADVVLLTDQPLTAVQAGDNTWAAIDESGSVLDGEFAGGSTPQPLAAIVGATRVATGGVSYVRNGCAIDAESHIWCWGQNHWGQLGDGTFTGRADPAPISTGATYQAVASSGAHVCAVTTAGDVECWGWSSRGQSGVSAQRCPDPGTAGIEWPCTTSPVPLPLPGPATDVSVGPGASCALLTDRTVWCWGLNTAGQLGRGTVGADSSTPEQVQ